jgi:hypothetical protein
VWIRERRAGLRRPKCAGKRLKLKVTVSKSGYKARSRTLNFGTIKK